MKKTKTWIDVLIVFLMLTFVYLLCQPIGRRWDKELTDVFTGDEGVFASDTDTYYYLRVAKEYSENGFSSIGFFYSREEDSLRTSLQKNDVDDVPHLMSLLAAGLWFLLNAVGIHVGIYSVAIHFCSFILALCTIPLYLFLNRRVSRVASVVGALFAVLAPPIFKHSVYGFFDTDAMCCFLGISIVLLLFECFVENNQTRRIKYSAILFCAIALLALTWKVFFFYPLIAVGMTTVSYITIRVFRRKEKNVEWRYPLYTVMGMGVISAAFGWRAIKETVGAFFSFETETEKWPAASLRVTELKVPRFLEPNEFWEIFATFNADFLSYLGGLFCGVFLFFSIIICLRKFIRIIKQKEIELAGDAFVILATGIWFFGTLLMVSWGIRFMQMMIIPAAILIAYGMQFVFEYVKSQRHNTLVKRIIYIALAFLCFATMVLWKPVFSVVSASIILVVGFFESKSSRIGSIIVVFVAVLFLGIVEGIWISQCQSKPLVERTTADALTWIRENTDEDAVLADYWNLGYIYEYYSGRRAIADGGTYNGAVNYWLGTMLLSDDPKLSAGIARMLQVSGLDGTLCATEICGGKEKATILLKTILPLTREDAFGYMSENGFDEGDIITLLNLTHPKDCPDIYFVMTRHMLKRLSLLEDYYRWNFESYEDGDETTAFGAFSIEMPADGDSVACRLQKPLNQWRVILQSDGETYLGWLESDEGRKRDFQRFLYVKEGKIVFDRRIDETQAERELFNGEVLLAIEEEGRVSVFICAESHVDSTLVRLYLLNGREQNTFTKVYEGTLPEAVSGDKSRTQGLLGTSNTEDFFNCGVSVWKVSFD